MTTMIRDQLRENKCSKAHVIDGRVIAAELEKCLAASIDRATEQRGIRPGLAIVSVGQDKNFEIYLRSRLMSAQNMHLLFCQLPQHVPESYLLEHINRLNYDSSVHGILVQLPLPSHLASHQILQAISPAKDVDGANAVSAGMLSTGLPGIVPSTPLASCMIAKRVRGQLAGLEAVVIGRSDSVGKPLTQLLLMENATVTIVHSKTRDLASICRRADVIFAAAGQPQMVTRDWIRPGATVVDIGFNRVRDKSGKARIVGDVAMGEVLDVAGAISPVPGGVGPVSIACLMLNTFKAACAQNGMAY